MKTTLRSLFVWLLLLALPLQGVAAARMLATVAVAAPAVAVAQVAPAAYAGAPMTHCAMAAPAAPAHDTQQQQYQHQHQHQEHHDHGRHGAACGACCIGVAPAPAVLEALALGPPASTLIPFRAAHVTGGWRALPERPPRPSFA